VNRPIEPIDEHGFNVLTEGATNQIKIETIENTAAPQR